MHNLDDNTVWWEGLDKNPPEERHGLEGRAVGRQEYVANGSKLRPSQQPLHRSGHELPLPVSTEFNNPNGVPISAIVFGGRRAKTAPLVYQSCRLGARRVRRLHHGF